MRLRTIFLSTILLLSALELNAKGAEQKAVKGILDLRGINSPDHFIIKLNGEWEFYWKRMLRPNDFKTGIIKPDYYGNVPSYWTDYPSDSVKTEKFGYATYRLTVLFPKGFNKPLAIDLPVFDSSYDIYLDGKYYGGNGIPGESADRTKPEYKRNFFRISTESDSLKIIINVANYDHRRGGFWLPVKLGTFSEVQKKLANSWAAEWAVISLLLGFSVFFLLFYFLNPAEKLSGFFSMTTIGLALRPLFTSHFLIFNMIDLNWVWVVRFEYLVMDLVIIGWSWFVFNLYPSRFARITAWFITISYILIGTMTLFLPVIIFSYSTLVYYPLMIIMILYLIYKSFIGVLKKERSGLIVFFSFYSFIIRRTS